MEQKGTDPSFKCVQVQSVHPPSWRVHSPVSLCGMDLGLVAPWHWVQRLLPTRGVGGAVVQPAAQPTGVSAFPSLCLTPSSTLGILFNEMLWEL